MKYEKNPTQCNLCGGRVKYVSNAKIYGRKYGSGYIYICTKCGAYVGTHKPRPKEALGILADKEMRELKIKCHEIFDKKWKGEPTSTKKYHARNLAYLDLALKLNIPYEECHFGYFDLEMLKKAYTVLEKQ